MAFLYNFMLLLIVSSSLVCDCYLFPVKYLRSTSSFSTTGSSKVTIPRYQNHRIVTNAAARHNSGSGCRMMTSNEGWDNSSNTPPVPAVISSSNLLGGTYIGLSATFDANNNGQHIPIDTRYIPTSLVEWGYIPYTFETIVYENINDQQQQPKSVSMNNDTDDMLSIDDTTTSSTTTTTTNIIDMKRSVYTILPATGCDNDNLETIHTTEQYTDGSVTSSSSTTGTTTANNNDTTTAASSYTSIIYSLNNNNNTNNNASRHQIGIETCFRWIPDDIIDDNNITTLPTTLTDDIYRIRVNLNLQQQQQPMVGDSNNNDNDKKMRNIMFPSNRKWQFINPIRVSIEKQLSLLPLSTTTSSKIATSIMDTNYISQSGGLDSRSITQWLGPILHSERLRSFPIQTNTYSQQQQQQQQQSELPIRKDETDDDDCRRRRPYREVIRIPGNITISLFQLDDDDDDSYQINIGHVSTIPTATTMQRPTTIVSHKIPFSSS